MMKTLRRRRGRDRELRGKNRTIQRRTKMEKKEPTVVGKFYSDGCIHCINMQNDWKQLETYLKKEMPHVKIVNVESSNIEKGTRHVNRLIHPHQVSVNGFPTIFRFKNGKVDYFDEFKSKHVPPDENVKREFRYFKEWVHQ